MIFVNVRFFFCTESLNLKWMLLVLLMIMRTFCPLCFQEMSQSVGIYAVKKWLFSYRSINYLSTVSWRVIFSWRAKKYRRCYYSNQHPESFGKLINIIIRREPLIWGSHSNEAKNDNYEYMKRQTCPLKPPLIWIYQKMLENR